MLILCLLPASFSKTEHFSPILCGRHYQTPAPVLIPAAGRSWSLPLQGPRTHSCPVRHSQHPLPTSHPHPTCPECPLSPAQPGPSVQLQAAHSRAGKPQPNPGFQAWGWLPAAEINRGSLPWPWPWPAPCSGQARERRDPKGLFAVPAGLAARPCLCPGSGPIRSEDVSPWGPIRCSGLGVGKETEPLLSNEEVASNP